MHGIYNIKESWSCLEFDFFCSADAWFEVHLVNYVSETTDFVTSEVKYHFVHSTAHVTHFARPAVRTITRSFRTNMAMMVHLTLPPLFKMKLTLGAGSDNILYFTFPDQPRGLVVRVSDYWSWGPGFDSRFCHGDFSLKGKIPVVTMVWVV
jgi:hypothetical protein